MSYIECPCGIDRSVCDYHKSDNLSTTVSPYDTSTYNGLPAYDVSRVVFTVGVTEFTTSHMFDALLHFNLQDFSAVSLKMEDALFNRCKKNNLVDYCPGPNGKTVYTIGDVRIFSGLTNSRVGGIYYTLICKNKAAFAYLVTREH